MLVLRVPNLAQNVVLLLKLVLNVYLDFIWMVINVLNNVLVDSLGIQQFHQMLVLLVFYLAQNVVLRVKLVLIVYLDFI